jgi:methylated-DNA-[protein]-cysteine S-methyltransferase
MTRFVEPVSSDCFWEEVDSPIDRLLLLSDGRSLTGLRMEPHDEPQGGSRGQAPVLAEAARQLEEYFAGDREAFDLPLAPSGTTWQRRVWQGLLGVPYGTTTSYGALADSIGAGGKARAVGAANGVNPIAVIVPCHRVIGANGSLTGYGGGLDRKATLLRLEAGLRQSP